MKIIEPRKPNATFDIFMDESGGLHVIIDGARIPPVRWPESDREAAEEFEELAEWVKKDVKNLTTGVTASQRSVGYRENLSNVARTLGKFMFGPPGNPIRYGLLKHFSQALMNDGFVSILFSTESLKLRNLPWELALWEDFESGVTVGTHRNLTFVRRHLYTGHVADKSLVVDPERLRVTLISAAEKMYKYAFDEIKAHFAQWDAPTKGFHATERMTNEWLVQPVGMQADIFQFIGHGTTRHIQLRAPGGGGVGGSELHMRAGGLVDFFDAKALPKLFVVFCCYSFNHAGTNGFVPDLLGRGASAAVGMLGALRMDKAGPMSDCFYKELAASGRADVALQRVRAEIRKIEEINWLVPTALPPSDWFRPVLLVRSSQALEQFHHVPNALAGSSRQARGPSRDHDLITEVKRDLHRVFSPVRSHRGKLSNEELKDYVNGLTPEDQEAENEAEAYAQWEAHRMRVRLRALDAGMTESELHALINSGDLPSGSTPTRYGTSMTTPTKERTIAATPSAQPKPDTAGKDSESGIVRRALLIGSEIDGLRGVENDLEAMSKVLSRLDFTDICVLQREEASRQGIHEAFESLGERAGHDDPLVVYYAGHGSIADTHDMKGSIARNGARLPEFIMPYDFYEGDEFRGITSWELSVLFKRLTDKTPNVTVIMDCCHSGRIVRSAHRNRTAGQQGSDPASEKPMIRGMTGCSEGIAEHIEKLRKDNKVQDLDPQANPFLVRLLACETSEYAFEYLDDERKWRGRLSWGLTEVLSKLADSGDHASTSWQAIGQQLREMVKDYEYGRQNPNIEGPRNRLFASLEEENNTGVLTVAPGKGTNYVMHGGSLVGVKVGDKYKVRTPYKPANDPQSVVAVATVKEVRDVASTISLDFTSDSNRISKGIEFGFRAYPFEVNRPKLPVELHNGAAKVSPLRDAIEQSLYLELAGTEPPKAMIQSSGQDMWLADGDGRRLFKHSWKSDHGGIRAAVAALEKLAHGETARNISDGIRGPDGAFELVWGKVKDGELDDDQLALSNTVFQAGERYYITVSNHHKSDIYFSVFNVEMTGKVTLITRAHSTGHKIAPSGSYTLGGNVRTDHTKGVGLVWPEYVPTDVERDEELLVFVSSCPVDLRAIETWRDLEAERLLPRRGSELEQMRGDWCQLTRIRYRLQPGPNQAQ